MGGARAGTTSYRKMLGPFVFTLLELSGNTTSQLAFSPILFFYLPYDPTSLPHSHLHPLPGDTTHFQPNRNSFRTFHGTSCRASDPSAHRPQDSL